MRTSRPPLDLLLFLPSPERGRSLVSRRATTVRASIRKEDLRGASIRPELHGRRRIEDTQRGARVR